MSKTFDQGREEIAKLCKYFTVNRQAFLAPAVKEAHIRQNLIDPLFEALGWDVRNAAMAAPQYREVVPEDSLEVEGHQKAPDYTFRVGTMAKFNIEAKVKPETRFHALCHIFATLLSKNPGVVIVMVSEMLWHSDLKMTVIYSYGSQLQKLEAIKKLEIKKFG